MNLVIVESPAKAKTIEKYLGKDYKVLASYGHVRDLPQKELGIDTEKDFAPTYVISPKANKVISDIKRAEANSTILYLATDLDREGEAISWHILKALKMTEKDAKVKRIVFHEITKDAIQNAIKHPREVDMNLVDAQQGRRILDRLVGYKLSPLLWKKIKSGLSAGRVQSVAVRLVVEKEREIKAFVSNEYWLLGANLSKHQETNIFRAFLTEQNGKSIKKLDIKNAEMADKIELGLKEATYRVVKIDKKESLRKPSAPFTTSTLQMEASRKLGFSAKSTMMVAQKLYEAGHISYMRTDSTSLSKEAVTAIRQIIEKQYGPQYLPESEQKYSTKTKNAQEAHEAIRPSHVDKFKVSDDSREQRLYELIWKRTVASQMKPALVDVTNATIEAKTDPDLYTLLAKGEVMRFEGFIKVYTEGKDDEVDEVSGILPAMSEGEELDFQSMIKQQKFTEPPKRYTEATLVKKLESLGIGRPSTYAPTLTTIQDRGYVFLEEKRFFPTEIGMIVNDLLVEHFANIVDYQFTAKMEDKLDEVADGKRKWVPVIAEFYGPFIKNLEEKGKEISKDDVMKPEELGEPCPTCGKPLWIRHGRFGKFVACSGYPECKYSRPLGEKNPKEPEMAEEKCEKCGGNMYLKEGRFGKFYACENYPKCKTTKAIIQSSGVKCPDCGEGELIEKRTKRGKIFWGCSKYPGCKHATWVDPRKKSEETEEIVEEDSSQ